MRVVVAVFLALALSACGSADKPFLGFWKVQGDRFEYLKIEKNGEGHLLTRYGNSILDGSVERKEFPATIKDNTLTIGALGVSGVYKESDKTLVLNGKQVFAKVDDAEALKVIEAKEQENPAQFLAEKEAEYTKLFANPYNAAKYGYIDDVIEPRNTRFRIIRALQQLQTKKLTNPAKKHGNIPL